MTRDTMVERIEHVLKLAKMMPSKERADVGTLVAAIERELPPLLAALRSRPAPPDDLALRHAWEAGFRLCRSYGDNHHHFDGEQKERRWLDYIKGLAAPAPVAAPSVAQARDEMVEGLEAAGFFRAPVAAPAPHPAGGIRTDFRGSDGEMLAPTDEARKVISDCTARGAQLPDMHQLRSAITDIIVERNRQAGVGLRFRDVNTGVITDEFGREHPPSFEAKTHQDSLQNVAAPAPETPPDVAEGQCPRCGERYGAHGEWCRR